MSGPRRAKSRRGPQPDRVRPGDEIVIALLISASLGVDRAELCPRVYEPQSFSLKLVALGAIAAIVAALPVIGHYARRATREPQKRRFRKRNS